MIKKETKKEEVKAVPQKTQDVIDHTMYGVVQYKDNNTYAVIVNGDVKEVYVGVNAFNEAYKSFAQHFKP